jgi:hypothetical protein
VPSDQDFYQLLWDDLDRSSRFFKQAAPSQANKASARTLPPTKKAKASSTMPISPEPPKDRSLLQSPPESFEEAYKMVQEAWKVPFLSLRFPIELIGMFSLRKSPLVAAPHKASHQEPPALMHQLTNGSSKLKVAINKNLDSRLLKEWAFFKVLKATAAGKQTKLTPQTCCLLAVFVVSHSHVSVMHQDILISLA